MANEGRPVYCGNCGSIAQAGDTFCGVCGSRIPPDAQDAAPTQDIPTLVPPPPSVPGRRRNRKLVNGVMVGALLVLSLVGVGALALAGLGPGAGLLGGTKDDPAPSGAPDASGGSSVSTDAPPDPAFDHLLADLEESTDAPIMLPAELPDEMDLPAIDGYYSGEGYGIVFPYGPSETTAEPSNAETLGTLNVYPEDEDVTNEYFDAEKIEKVELPDGTEATLRYLVPAGRTGSQGPFWEGKFDRGGFTYNLKVTKPNEITKDEVKQALSTMVLVPEPEVSEPTTSPSGPSEPSWMSDEEIAALEEFGRDYDEAVRREDWEETYSMLEESSQQEFTEEEWAEKQQILMDTTGPPAPLESVGVEQEEQVADGPVTIRMTYEDGSDETMTALIPQVVEDPSESGEPKRLLTEEEISELEDLPSFPSESTASASPEATAPDSLGQSTEEIETEAQEAAEDYYRAAGSEDWDYTYDHLDAETQGLFTREEWFQKNEWFADNGQVIYHVESVRRLGTSSGIVVEVTLRLTYEDGSSSSRTTYFVYEDGEWKHAFGQEEQDLFMPDASYEEFVEAQE